MRGANAKRRTPKTVAPSVACDACLNWHPQGKHTASAAQRKINLVTMKKPPAHATMKKSTKTKGKPALRIAYRLQLSPSELRAIEFARGRYAWPDMLSAHVTEGGLVAFTEPEMWQWTDDVDSDAEGGHSPFPLAAGAFAEKLQNFYDERI